jgi:hypothetical protein
VTGKILNKNNMENYTFNVKDIFEEIPGDPDNVILKFPPEILEKTGWKEGDELEILVEDGVLSVKKYG